MKKNKNWDTVQAKRHYRISNWGLGLFDINEEGHVTVKTTTSEIDLYELSLQLINQGIKLPVLIRFPHILQRLLSALYTAFHQAKTLHNYQGEYIAAYPIKVNQQASVIQHFHTQTQWPISFEVGSKAELIACLGIVENQNQSIVCNGYKDETYIRLALIGTLLGHEVIIVLESLLEFEHVLRISNELEVTPILGMRVRLHSIAESNWQNTGGKRSKFGLTSNQVLQLVNELKQYNAISWMQMLHFHMGSQIPSLHDIRAGINEGMQYYAELDKLGLKFSKLNIGGGLGVDYEGSESNSYFSMNYTIADYANTIIEVVNKICKEKNIQAPTIFSENGRVMTAYHAVLLTDVIDAEFQRINSHVKEASFSQQHHTDSSLNSLIEITDKITLDLQQKVDTLESTKIYSQLMSTMQELDDKFSKGEISLAEKARAEVIAENAYEQLLDYKKSLSEKYKHELEEKFIEKYFCNFSIFQSTPDVWGLNQIFPILPVHRLNEFPQYKVRIHDLTCDSDGQIDRYIEDGDVKPYLSLHEFEYQHDYILGLFLVGAYQEILGDLHNLFGDTNAVNVELKSDGGYQICEEEPGDTIQEVLSYVHIDTTKMRQNWLEKLKQMNVSGTIKNSVLQELEAALQASSYLN